MNRAFAARIAIDTPLSLRGLLHLDGLLGALAVARGQAPDDLPLQRTGTVWHGSAAILETGVFGPINSSVTRIKHVAFGSVPEGLFDHLPPAKRRIGEMSPFRNVLSTYPLVEGVYAVWFTGRGSPDHVADLLGGAYGIGSMSQVGYGHVTGFDVMAIPEEPLSGIALRSGLPARAVPLQLWRENLGLDVPEDAVVSEQTDRPPYWAGQQVTCVAPMQIDLGDHAKLWGVGGTGWVSRPQSGSRLIVQLSVWRDHPITLHAPTPSCAAAR